ncbi:MAG: restriction endonuclease subunit S [Verrucomicrobiota bacterium]
MKKGWEIKTLGDICSFENGDRGENYPSKSVQTRSGVPFINAGHLGESGIDFSDMNYIPRERFNLLGNGKIQKNDILFCLRGSLGKFASVGDLNEGAIASSLIIIRPHQAILNEFALAYFQSDLCAEMIREFKNGAAQPNLAGASLKKFVIPVPPLPEQHRIVTILDEAFLGLATAKANAEKNLQNARSLFESHLQSVFSQRGKGWVDRQLATLCHEITVGHVGSMKTEYKASGVPFLRSQNIRPFQVSMENAMFIDQAFHRSLKKSQLRPGDLAIVRTGYPGTAAVIPHELPDSNCSDLVIVRPTKEVDPHFLAAFFNSAFGKQLVLGKIVGAAQKHFNVTAAKEVMLHVPPLSKQHEIIKMIDDLREETTRLAAIYQQKLAALEALKKSLLHQAFSGEL